MWNPLRHSGLRLTALLGLTACGSASLGAPPAAGPRASASGPAAPGWTTPSEAGAVGAAWQRVLAAGGLLGPADRRVPAYGRLEGVTLDGATVWHLAARHPDPHDRVRLPAEGVALAWPGEVRFWHAHPDAVSEDGHSRTCTRFLTVDEATARAARVWSMHLETPDKAAQDLAGAEYERLLAASTRDHAPALRAALSQLTPDASRPLVAALALLCGADGAGPVRWLDPAAALAPAAWRLTGAVAPGGAAPAPSEGPTGRGRLEVGDGLLLDLAWWVSADALRVETAVIAVRTRPPEE
jgi:hypothetical protein